MLGFAGSRAKKTAWLAPVYCEISAKMRQSQAVTEENAPVRVLGSSLRPIF
jgi:hypothetical protein